MPLVLQLAMNQGLHAVRSSYTNLPLCEGCIEHGYIVLTEDIPQILFRYQPVVCLARRMG